MNEPELLFTHLLNCGRSELYLKKMERVSPELSVRLAQVLKQRIWGEPLQYILGSTEFMGLEFRVNSKVLIPRPETEILVVAAAQYLRKREGGSTELRVLDLGTGSGCIAVSLAKLFPAVEIDASDISAGALEVARRNASMQMANINFIESDLFSSEKFKSRGYDLIVSNPPYVSSDEMKRLQIEISREPRVALDAGKDGLDFYRRIIRQAADFLKDNGLLALEMGYGQDREIENIFYKSAKFEIIETIKDLSSINRVIIARRKS